jgi:hypothetical protein
VTGLTVLISRLCLLRHKQLLFAQPLAAATDAHTVLVARVNVDMLREQQLLKACHLKPGVLPVPFNPQLQHTY